MAAMRRIEKEETFLKTLEDHDRYIVIGYGNESHLNFFAQMSAYLMHIYNYIIVI
jgi:N-dimethylarginine dimethylaminohydrolase